jgi:hypothetical protein
MPNPYLSQQSNKKSLLIVAVLAGTLAFLFFGAKNLADVFYFLAGIIGIAAFVMTKQIKDELDKVKSQISERVEEIEFRIDKLEEKGN